MNILFMYIYYVFPDVVLSGSGIGKKIAGIRFSRNGKTPDLQFAFKCVIEGTGGENPYFRQNQPDFAINAHDKNKLV